MAIAEALLHLDAEAALRVQLDEVLTQGLKAEFLQFDDPVVLSGTKTGVTARIDRTRCPIEFWDIVDSVQFEYTRLDLAGFTTGLSLTVGGVLPLSGKECLELLLVGRGIPISDRDGSSQHFSSVGKVTLQPGTASYRWTGQVDITLANKAYMAADYLPLIRLSLGLTPTTASDALKATLASQLTHLNAQRLPVPLTESMFSLGIPKLVDDFHAPFNTEITLSFSGIYYGGSLAVRYNRFSFEQTFVHPLEISGTTIVSAQQLVPDLSRLLNCIIRTFDVENTSLPTVGLGETTTIIVRFVPECLAYQGELMVRFTRTG